VIGDSDNFGAAILVNAASINSDIRYAEFFCDFATSQDLCPAIRLDGLRLMCEGHGG
jgi:hypothetical protein